NSSFHPIRNRWRQIDIQYVKRIIQIIKISIDVNAYQNIATAAPYCTTTRKRQLKRTKLPLQITLHLTRRVDMRQASRLIVKVINFLEIVAKIFRPDLVFAVVL